MDSAKDYSPLNWPYNGIGSAYPSILPSAMRNYPPTSTPLTQSYPNYSALPSHPPLNSPVTSIPAYQPLPRLDPSDPLRLVDPLRQRPTDLDSDTLERNQKMRAERERVKLLESSLATALESVGQGKTTQANTELQYQQAISQLREKEATITRLQEQLTKQTRTLVDVERQLEASRKSASTAPVTGIQPQQYEELRSQHSDALARLNACTAQAETLKSENKDLKALLTQQQGMFVNSQGKMDTYIDQLAQSKAKIEQHEGQIKQMKEHNIILIQKIDELKATVSKLTQENTKLTATIETLTKSNSTLSQQHQDLQTELKEARQRAEDAIAELQREKDAVKQYNEALQAELKAHEGTKTKLVSIEAQLDRCEGMQNGSSNQNTVLHDALEECKKQLKLKEEKYEVMFGDKIRAEGVSEKLEEKIRLLEAQISQQQTIIGQLSGSIWQDNSGKSSDSQGGNKDARSSPKSEENELNVKLYSDITAHHARICELQGELSAAKMTITQLEAITASLRQDKEALHTALQEINKVRNVVNAISEEQIPGIVSELRTKTASLEEGCAETKDSIVSEIASVLSQLRDISRDVHTLVSLKSTDIGSSDTNPKKRESPVLSEESVLARLDALAVAVEELPAKLVYTATQRRNASTIRKMQNIGSGIPNGHGLSVLELENRAKMLGIHTIPTSGDDESLRLQKLSSQLYSRDYSNGLGMSTRGYDASVLHGAGHMLDVVQDRLSLEASLGVGESLVGNKEIWVQIALRQVFHEEFAKLGHDFNKLSRSVDGKLADYGNSVAKLEKSLLDLPVAIEGLVYSKKLSDDLSAHVDRLHHEMEQKLQNHANMLLNEVKIPLVSTVQDNTNHISSHYKHILDTLSHLKLSLDSHKSHCNALLTSNSSGAGSSSGLTTMGVKDSMVEALRDNNSIIEDIMGKLISTNTHTLMVKNDANHKHNMDTVSRNFSDLSSHLRTISQHVSTANNSLVTVTSQLRDNNTVMNTLDSTVQKTHQFVSDNLHSTSNIAHLCEDVQSAIRVLSELVQQQHNDDIISRKTMEDNLASVTQFTQLQGDLQTRLNILNGALDTLTTYSRDAHTNLRSMLSNSIPTQSLIPELMSLIQEQLRLFQTTILRESNVINDNTQITCKAMSTQVSATCDNIIKHVNGLYKEIDVLCERLHNDVCTNVRDTVNSLSKNTMDKLSRLDQCVNELTNRISTDDEDVIDIDTRNLTSIARQRGSSPVSGAENNADADPNVGYSSISEPNADDLSSDAASATVTGNGDSESRDQISLPTRSLHAPLHLSVRGKASRVHSHAILTLLQAVHDAVLGQVSAEQAKQQLLLSALQKSVVASIKASLAEHAQQGIANTSSMNEHVSTVGNTLLTTINNYNRSVVEVLGEHCDSFKVLLRRHAASLEGRQDRSFTLLQQFLGKTDEDLGKLHSGITTSTKSSLEAMEGVRSDVQALHEDIQLHFATISGQVDSSSKKTDADLSVINNNLYKVAEGLNNISASVDSISAVVESVSADVGNVDKFLNAGIVALQEDIQTLSAQSQSDVSNLTNTMLQNTSLLSEAINSSTSALAGNVSVLSDRTQERCVAAVSHVADAVERLAVTSKTGFSETQKSLLTSFEAASESFIAQCAAKMHELEADNAQKSAVVTLTENEISKALKTLQSTLSDKVSSVGGSITSVLSEKMSNMHTSVQSSLSTVNNSLYEKIHSLNDVMDEKSDRVTRHLLNITEKCDALSSHVVKNASNSMEHQNKLHTDVLSSLSQRHDHLLQQLTAQAMETKKFVQEIGVTVHSGYSDVQKQLRDGLKTLEQTTISLPQPLINSMSAHVDKVGKLILANMTTQSEDMRSNFTVTNEKLGQSHSRLTTILSEIDSHVNTNFETLQSTLQTNHTSTVESLATHTKTTLSSLSTTENTLSQSITATREAALSAVTASTLSATSSLSTLRKELLSTLSDSQNTVVSAVSSSAKTLTEQNSAALASINSNVDTTRSQLLQSIAGNETKLHTAVETAQKAVSALVQAVDSKEDEYHRTILEKLSSNAKWQAQSAQEIRTALDQGQETRTQSILTTVNSLSDTTKTLSGNVLEALGAHTRELRALLHHGLATSNENVIGHDSESVDNIYNGEYSTFTSPTTHPSFPSTTTTTTAAAAATAATVSTSTASASSIPTSVAPLAGGILTNAALLSRIHTLLSRTETIQAQNTGVLRADMQELVQHLISLRNLVSGQGSTLEQRVSGANKDVQAKINDAVVELSTLLSSANDTVVKTVTALGDFVEHTVAGSASTTAQQINSTVATTAQQINDAVADVARDLASRIAASTRDTAQTVVAVAKDTVRDVNVHTDAKFQQNTQDVGEIVGEAFGAVEGVVDRVVSAHMHGAVDAIEAHTEGAVADGVQQVVGGVDQVVNNVVSKSDKALLAKLEGLETLNSTSTAVYQHMQTLSSKTDIASLGSGISEAIGDILNKYDENSDRIVTTITTHISETQNSAAEAVLQGVSAKQDEVSNILQQKYDASTQAITAEITKTVAANGSAIDAQLLHQNEVQREQFSQLHSAVSASHKDLDESLAKLSADQQGNFSTLFSTVHTNTKSVLDGQRELLSGVDQQTQVILEDTHKAYNAVNENITGVQQSLQIVSTSLSTVHEDVSNVVASLSGVHDAVDEMTSSLDTVKTTVESFSDVCRSGNDEAIQQCVVSLSAEIDGVGAGMDKYYNSLYDLVRTSNHNLSVLVNDNGENTREFVKSGVTRVLENSERQHSQVLSNMDQSMKTILHNISETGSQINENVKDNVHTIEEQVRFARKTLDNVSEAVAQSSSLVTKVDGGMQTLIRGVNESLHNDTVLNENISGVSAKLADVRGDIAVVTQKQDTVGDSVSSIMKAAVSTIQTSLESTTDQITTTMESVAALPGPSSIISLNSVVAEVDTRTKSMTRAFEHQDTLLRDSISRLRSLETTITTSTDSNATRINELRGAIASTQQGVVALTDEVKDHRHSAQRRHEIVMTELQQHWAAKHTQQFSTISTSLNSIQKKIDAVSQDAVNTQRALASVSTATQTLQKTCASVLDAIDQASMPLLRSVHARVDSVSSDVESNSRKNNELYTASISHFAECREALVELLNSVRAVQAETAKLSRGDGMGLNTSFVRDGLNTTTSITASTQALQQLELGLGQITVLSRSLAQQQQVILESLTSLEESAKLNTTEVSSGLQSLMREVGGVAMHIQAQTETGNPEQLARILSSVGLIRDRVDNGLKALHKDISVLVQEGLGVLNNNILSNTQVVLQEYVKQSQEQQEIANEQTSAILTNMDSNARAIQESVQKASDVLHIAIDEATTAVGNNVTEGMNSIIFHLDDNFLDAIHSHTTETSQQLGVSLGQSFKSTNEAVAAVAQSIITQSERVSTSNTDAILSALSQTAAHVATDIGKATVAINENMNALGDDIQTALLHITSMTGEQAHIHDVSSDSDDSVSGR